MLSNIDAVTKFIYSRQPKARSRSRIEISRDLQKLCSAWSIQETYFEEKLYLLELEKKIHDYLKIKRPTNNQKEAIRNTLTDSLEKIEWSNHPTVTEYHQAQQKGPQARRHDCEFLRGLSKLLHGYSKKNPNKNSIDGLFELLCFYQATAQLEDIKSNPRRRFNYPRPKLPEWIEALIKQYGSMKSTSTYRSQAKAKLHQKLSTQK